MQALIRATLAHTPADPFVTPEALRCHHDGGLLIRDGRIVAAGDWAEVHRLAGPMDVTDWRPGFVLPGLVDAHVHFPQVRIIGSLGRSLLEWLDEIALPEEARMADVDYAASTARLFLHALATHGTTTALVFGAHYADATAALFEEASRVGLRITTGLVHADTLVPPPLRQTPESAYRDASALMARYHRRGRLRYAVTPRFALSNSSAMLEVCRALATEHPDVRLHTHLNENRDEVAGVARDFPTCRDYLAVYEQFALAGPRTVFAHNVWPTSDELTRLATTGASIAHCPSSNAALASGAFPMQAHLRAGVPFALGTDVGAGVGFGILREALQAYLTQRLLPDGVTLGPAHLLYLATRAGARALGMEEDIGDFTPGKAADFLRIQPRQDSVLHTALARADSAEQALAAVLTLADREAIGEVWVGGERIALSPPVD